MRRFLRLFVFSLMFGAAVSCIALPAEAAVPGIIAGSAKIALSSGSNGSHIGTIALTNIGSTWAKVTPTVLGNLGCKISPSQSTLKPGIQTILKLTFPAACKLKHHSRLRLAFAHGTNPANRIIALTIRAKAKSSPSWRLLLYAFGTAFVILTAFYVYLRSTWHSRAATRLARKDWEKQLDKHVTGANGEWPAGSVPISGLATDWSFKDNWASNITIGSTVIIGLLAASNILQAVLGSKPLAALSFLAVASGIASLFVGLGPLIVKAIGDGVDQATVRGVKVAAGSTLIGVIGQIAAAALQAMSLLDPHRLPQIGAALLALIVGGLVLKYAYVSICAWISDAMYPLPEAPSDEIHAAQIIASAIRSRDRGSYDSSTATPAETETPPARRKQRNAFL